MKFLKYALIIAMLATTNVFAGADGDGEFEANSSRIKFTPPQLEAYKLDGNGTVTIPLGIVFKKANVQLCVREASIDDPLFNSINPLTDKMKKVYRKELKKTGNDRIDLKREFSYFRSIIRGPRLEGGSFAIINGQAYFTDANVNDNCFSGTHDIYGKIPFIELEQQLENNFKKIVERYNLYVSQIHELLMYSMLDVNASNYRNYLFNHEILTYKFAKDQFASNLQYQDSYFYSADGLKVITELYPNLNYIVNSIPTQNVTKSIRYSRIEDLAVQFYEFNLLVDLANEIELYSPGTPQHISRASQIKIIWQKYHYGTLRNDCNQEYICKPEFTTILATANRYAN